MIQLQPLMSSHNVRKFTCTFSDTLHGIFMYFFVMFSLKVNGFFCKPFLIGTRKFHYILFVTLRILKQKSRDLRLLFQFFPTLANISTFWLVFKYNKKR